MDILISFCNTSEIPGFPNLGIFNTETQDIQIIDLPREIPPTGITGLTVSSKYIFIGLQHSTGGIHAALSPPGLLIFSKENFSLLTWYPMQLVSDIHSMILHDHETTLLIASTGTDEIIEVKLDDDKVISEKVYMHLGTGTRMDNRHVNSICEWHNEIYVSAFGEKEEGGDWSTARNGYLMNLTKGIKIIEGLEHPHSLTVINNRLAYCESRKKAFRFVDGDQVDSLPGYTRGLCAAGDKIYVGTSKHRKKSKSTGKKVSSTDQQSLGCTLSIISSPDLHVEKIIDLNNYAFEIYDLLPLHRSTSWPVIHPQNYRLIYEQSWFHRAEKVIDQIQTTIPKNETLLLVDENMLQIKHILFPEHTSFPFLEKNGISWGPPENEKIAFQELERMKQEKGAGYIAFAWPAFWWFNVYPEFTDRLKEDDRCILENEDVMIFKF